MPLVGQLGHRAVEIDAVAVQLGRLTGALDGRHVGAANRAAPMPPCPPRRAMWPDSGAGWWPPSGGVSPSDRWPPWPRRSRRPWAEYPGVSTLARLAGQRLCRTRRTSSAVPAAQGRVEELHDPALARPVPALHGRKPRPGDLCSRRVTFMAVRPFRARTRRPHRRHRAQLRPTISRWTFRGSDALIRCRGESRLRRGRLAAGIAGSRPALGVVQHRSRGARSPAAKYSSTVSNRWSAKSAALHPARPPSRTDCRRTPARPAPPPARPPPWPSSSPSARSNDPAAARYRSIALAPAVVPSSSSANRTSRRHIVRAAWGSRRAPLDRHHLADARHASRTRPS